MLIINVSKREHKWIIPLMAVVEDGSGSRMGQLQVLLILLSVITVKKLSMKNLVISKSLILLWAKL